MDKNDSVFVPHNKRFRMDLKWIRDEAGNSAVEFALIMPVVVMLLAGVADLGIAMRERLKISSAASAAAVTAFVDWSNVDSSTLADYKSKINKVISSNAGLQTNLTTTILINNRLDESAYASYYCVSGSPAAFSIAASSTTDCGGNVLAGKYVTISISGHIDPLFAYTKSYAGGMLAIAESVTVRVN